MTQAGGPFCGGRNPCRGDERLSGPRSISDDWLPEGSDLNRRVPSMEHDDRELARPQCPGRQMYFHSGVDRSTWEQESENQNGNSGHTFAHIGKPSTRLTH